MNENAFFDDLLLSFLFKKKCVSTIEIESKFGDVFDKQNVNNVVCNRNKTTSYISRGFMSYDDSLKTLSITPRGEEFIKSKYSVRRKRRK